MYFIYGGVYTSTLISQYPSPHHLSFKRDVRLGSTLLGCLFYLAGRAHW